MNEANLTSLEHAIERIVMRRVEDHNDFEVPSGKKYHDVARAIAVGCAEEILGEIRQVMSPKPGIALSAVRVEELLDYASSYGALDENSPDGTAPTNGGRPMCSARRATIVAYKKVLGQLPDDYAFPRCTKDPT